MITEYDTTVLDFKTISRISTLLTQFVQANSYKNNRKGYKKRKFTYDVIVQTKEYFSYRLMSGNEVPVFRAKNKLEQIKNLNLSDDFKDSKEFITQIDILLVEINMCQYEQSIWV